MSELHNQENTESKNPTTDQTSAKSNLVNGNGNQPQNLEKAISIDEQKRLAKLGHSSSERLLPEQYSIDPDRPAPVERSASDRPSLKTGFVITAVGGAMGLLTVVWFGFLAPRTRSRDTVATIQPNASPKIVQNEAADLRAKLAFQDQQRSLQETPPQRNLVTRSTPKSTFTVREPIAARASSAVSSPETVSPRSQRFYRSAPQSPIKTTEQSRLSSPPVDLFKRWSELAALGEARSNAETASDSLTQPTLTNARNDSPPSTRNLPSIDEQSIASTDSAVTSERSPITASAISSNPTSEPSHRATPESFTNETLQPSFDTSQPSTAIASSQFSEASLSPSTTEPESNLSQGAKGILSRTPVSQMTEESTHKNIALGTIVNARVIMPLIWDDNTKKTPEMQRFAVELTEDMKAMDGSAVLPTGTVFVAEASGVSEGNNLVSANAIAVIHPNSESGVRQERIPLGNLLVRGEGGQVLVAKNLNSAGSTLARQDLMIGVLNSLGKVGEILNQPDVQTHTASSNDRLDQTTISRSRQPQIWAAALEGLLGTAADRLSKRSDQAAEEFLRRPNVAILPKGTKVSIVVNTLSSAAP